MERLTAPIEIKTSKDDGSFTGYAAIFGNVDLGHDIILPGAFKSAKTTADGKIRIAIGHNLKQLAGKASFYQDDRGLRVEGQLNLDVSYVKDAYALMKSGVLDGLSVGFNILHGGAIWEKREDDYVRLIKEAELWEFSLVAFGMNPEALVDSVKAVSVREFEAQLKGLGYSQREAKALASSGFKALTPRDEGEPNGTLAELKNELLNELKQFKWS